MKTVSESTWSFQIIIFFILIFACFLILVLSYNKAFIVKNRTLTVLEKYEGATKESIEIINGIMYNASYKTTGKCPVDDGWVGALDLEGDIEEVKESGRYYYCLRQNKRNSIESDYGNSKKTLYYDVRVFYNFNLPVIGNIAIYSINGQTKDFVGSNEIIDEMK